MPRRRVDVKKAIMDALNVHGGLTWTGLLKAANVSKGALSSHLKRLMKAGLVERVVADDERPPSVRYRISPVQAISEEEKFEEFDDAERFLSQSSLLDFERMREENPKLAAQLMEEYFKTNLTRLSIGFLSTALNYTKRFQAEDKLDLIKAALNPGDAEDTIRLLIGKRLEEWMDFLAFGLAMMFLTTSSLHSELAVPILNDLKNDYEAKYRKEQPIILSLLNKVKADMISVQVDNTILHGSLAESRIGRIVKEVLKKIREDGDQHKIRICRMYLKRLEEPWGIKLYAESRAPTIVINETKMEDKSDRDITRSIAHVLAHLALDHQNVRPEEEDREADRLARLWLQGTGRPLVWFKDADGRFEWKK